MCKDTVRACVNMLDVGAIEKTAHAGGETT